jgi:hypothetical protein
VLRVAACLLVAALCPTALCGPVRAVEHVVFRREKAEHSASGRVLVTAQDGGILLETATGTLWTIEPDEIVRRTSDDAPFAPPAADELGRQVLAELPDGFELYSTRHYLIAYNTSRPYAEWCGALLERLFMGFHNYWSRKGLKLEEPAAPLVAVIFSSREAYARHSQSELGGLADAVIGHYSLRTNLVMMYDLTGVESLRTTADRRSSAATINRVLARPEAEMSVATIIHEATHQIAFNCGLQKRFADVPLWVSEGLAVFFETPDLASARGWRTIGAVNHNRLAQFRRYLADRGPRSLETLIADDKRIRDTRTALDAYAEAWALNYYLLQHHPRKYVDYLRRLSEKPQLVWDDPQTRLAEFRSAFGDDLGRLDVDFLRYMQKVR